MTGQRSDQRAAARKLGEALRSLQQQSGRPLRSLESQVRISDSSLSRYFRGETVPTWPVVRDLCRALDADPSAYRALWEAADPHRSDEPAPSATAAVALAPAPPPRPTRWRRLREAGSLSGRGTALAVVLPFLAAALVAALLLLLPFQAKPGGEPSQGAEAEADTGGHAGVLVHNVEKKCQEPRTNSCALSLAYSPYRPYITSNSADRVWHHDLLQARCTVANGVAVTDENHKHTSIWVQVTRNGKHLWLPGIRIHPDHLNQLTAVLPTCTP
ncbi:helix-turn-helix domain-containing protein [Streptomyces sp. NPDC051561]|uniref:helix-turn-helix domain-containing protein n=1 Tax=Streptomyces sp. NPDC051561 TaxID=3365658 RepID=UPI0037960534